MLESTIVDAVRAAVGRVPERVAVRTAESTFTYAEMEARATAAAVAISERARGETIGLLLPNQPAFLVSLLGALWAGKTVAVLPTLAPPPLLRGMAAQAGLDTILTSSALAASAEGAGVAALVVESFPAQPARRFAPASRAGEAAVLLYTSGTTGLPKAVMLSDQNILSNAEGCRDAAGFTNDEVMLAILPLFHAYGLTVTLLLPLMLGGTVALQERFVPRSVLRAIEEHRVTALVAVPSQYRLLVKEPTPAKTASLQLCIAGAERLPENVSVEFERRFRRPILQGYGATEAAPVVSMNPPQANRPGTVGRPLPNLRVTLHEEGEPVAAGATAEIQVEGPNVMLGYFRNPGATAEKIVNGALRTGDRGFLDAEGYLHLAGRADDLIKIAGEKIYPAEVEHALERIQGVEEALVVGVPDEKHGTMLRAYVQPRPGAELHEDGLRSACRDCLEAVKIPRSFVLVEQMPRTPSGKVDKRALASRSE